MTPKVEMVDADKAKVGLSITMTKKVFDKLDRLAAESSMEGWSAVIARLIERA